jgi:hypothetical protein
MLSTKICSQQVSAQQNKDEILRALAAFGVITRTAALHLHFFLIMHSLLCLAEVIA